MRHALTKRQFKETGINGMSYRFTEDKDCGEHFARLDCKVWGAACLFLYLTTTDGYKFFIPVFKHNNYMGFLDIPIGAVVLISINYYLGAEHAYLYDAEWIQNETDPKEAEKHYDYYENEDGTTQDVSLMV